MNHDFPVYHLTKLKRAQWSVASWIAPVEDGVVRVESGTVLAGRGIAPAGSGMGQAGSGIAPADLWIGQVESEMAPAENGKVLVGQDPGVIR